MHDRPKASTARTRRWRARHPEATSTERTQRWRNRHPAAAALADIRSNAKQRVGA